jgi:hypothetical protein
MIIGHEIRINGTRVMDLGDLFLTNTIEIRSYEKEGGRSEWVPLVEIVVVNDAVLTDDDGTELADDDSENLTEG